MIAFLSTLFILLICPLFAEQHNFLYSNCIGLSDGYHWLKLLDDTDDKDYPITHVLCDNEFMIIDVNHDPNLIDYFDSWDTYHYALAGSKDKLDGKNWEEWWLPNAQFTSDSDDSYFKYAISPSCDACDTDANANSIQKYSDQTYADEYGDRTGYYMTGTMFGCMANHKALRDCAWDWDTYECGFCTNQVTNQDESYTYITASDTDTIHTYQSVYERSGAWMTLGIGLCGVYPQASYTDSVPSTVDDCFDFYGIKPSIGTDGRYCMCVQPTEQTTVEVSEESLNKYQKEKEERESVIETETYSVDDIYKLYQTDFEDGTYRITKSGTYKIMEDIEFDFNSPDNYLNPNQGDAWWPKKTQSDDYPGAYSMRDEYFMGFFAGITVETNDVIIDLNGFTIAQSKAFYYQQRQFACISLKSVIFNLNQGPGIFGTDPKFASNVVIKNGNIGLSSHFGIHGVWNENVLIENVHIFDFETHGIEMSYFTDLVITDVDIGPSSTIAYLKGEYAYSRFTLQRMEMVSENYNGKTDYSEYFPMKFGNRDESVSFHEITRTLRSQMDMAFKYVMDEEEYDDDDDEWSVAKALFINENGLPYGGVMYGLFLNLFFANVFIIHPSLKHANNVEINNLKIHDLKHNTMEYVRFDEYEVGPYHNPYAAGIDAMSLLGEEQISVGSDSINWETVTYIGDALTDAHIALMTATTDPGIWGVSLIPDDFINWAIGSNEWDNDDDNSHPWLGCNGDRMSHLAKGVMGIRIDGVEDVQINGLEITDIYEYSPLPYTVCGKYYDVFASTAIHFKGGGHFLENSPYSYGYTGNRIHGIFADYATITMTGDVSIHDLYSDTGLVRGIGLYLSTDLVIQDDEYKSIDGKKRTGIKLYNMAAGVELIGMDTSELEHPFVSADVQPITVFSETNNYKYEPSEFDETTKSAINCKTSEFYASITAPTDDLSEWISVLCMYADGGYLDYDNRHCESHLITRLLSKMDGVDSKGMSFRMPLFVIIVLAAVMTCLCVWYSKSQKKNEYSDIHSHSSEHARYGAA